MKIGVRSGENHSSREDSRERVVLHVGQEQELTTHRKEKSTGKLTDILYKRMHVIEDDEEQLIRDHRTIIKNSLEQN